MAAKRVQFVRARKAAGYTQERLAEVMHVDRSTVVRWEAGGSEPLPYKRPKLAKVLRMSPDRLSELLAEAEDMETDVDADIPFDPMRRRTLMTWGLATTATAGLGVSGVGNVGMADVLRLQRTTDRLCSLDYRHGGETLWQAGMASIHDAYAMLEHGSYTLRVGQKLLRATGNLHIRTGWLACDAGQHAVAHASFTDALTIARQAGDVEIETRGLAGLGFQSNLTGRPREGLRFSLAAEDAARGLWCVSRMTAVPLMHLAVANARSGDFTAAEAVVTRARKALDADRGEQTADWAAFMSPFEVDAVEATCAIEAGKAPRAEALLERAIAGYGDGFARNVALYRVRLTQARVKGGAVDGAVESANAVLDAVADGLDSWRVTMEFGRVMHSMVAFPTALGVAQLRERYTDMVS